VDDENVESAGFGIRLAGRLIDYAPTFVASLMSGVVLAFIAGVIAVSRKPPDSEVLDPMMTKSVLTVLGTLLATTFYHAFSESIGGASLGKRLLGLEVVDEDLQPATLTQGWKRNLAFFVDGFFFGLVAYNAMEKSPTRQRIGDRWAKTRVVMRRSLPPALRRPTPIFVFAFFGAMGIAVETSIVAYVCSYWLLTGG